MGQVEELRAEIVAIRDALRADLDADCQLEKIAGRLAQMRLDRLALRLQGEMDAEDAGQMAAAGVA
jgi:hypothetical protein